MKFKIEFEEIIPRLPGENKKQYQALKDFCMFVCGVTELSRLYNTQSHEVAPPTKSYNTLRTWALRFNWNERKEIYKYEASKLKEQKFFEQVESIREKWVEASQLALDKALEMMKTPLYEVKKTGQRNENGELQPIVIKPAKWNSAVAPQYLNASVNMANSVIGDLTNAIETCKRFGYEVISKQELEYLKNGELSNTAPTNIQQYNTSNQE